MQRLLMMTTACACLVSCGPDHWPANIDDDTPTAGAALTIDSAGRAVRPTDQGWLIHGVHVTRDAMAKWAPIVVFHPQERYLPCSIEHLLRGSTLVDAHDHVLMQHPSQADLQRFPSADNRVILNPSSYNGDPLDTQHQVQAPMYVSAQVPQDASFVDLNYLFLMAFNGSQSARLKLFGHSTELSLPHFADHQGDIESITVRVTPDFQKVLFVRFESHGHSLFVKPEQAHFVGTHVAVLSALNSHASYNLQAFAGHHQHVDARISAMGFGIDVLDITDATGATWKPFAVDSQGQTHDIGRLHFVGLDDRYEALGDQAWVAFAGRFGDAWENKFEGVKRPDGTAPNFAIRACANGLIQAAIGLGKTRAFTSARGPVGLAARSVVQVTEPTWVPPPQVHIQ